LIGNTVLLMGNTVYLKGNWGKMIGNSVNCLVILIFATVYQLFNGHKSLKWRQL